VDAARAEQLKAKDVRTDPIEDAQRFPNKLGYFLDYTRRSLIGIYGEPVVFGGDSTSRRPSTPRCSATPRRPWRRT